MHITANFDSGNIQVISSDNADNIRLAIKKDHQSDFYQWFHFKLFAEAGEEHVMTIENASDSAYPDGWKEYQALASYDRETWFRVPTEYNGKELTIRHTPEQESVYYAYFIPYSYERHQDLVQSAQQSIDCYHELLGETIDGRELNLLVIGEPAEHKNTIWVTARQHPGESMAEWFMEGLITRLLDDEDGVARKLLDENVFYVVPNMNPDGSVRGHLRTNAVGTNLNREWAEPSLEKSPEVFYVLKRMQETGVDMFLDVHGDEALPYNFVAGCEGIPSYDERHKDLEETFKSAFLAATPEFQTQYGYELDEPGKANMTVANSAVGERFKCLSYTLEMPFKDNADLPDEDFGWSVARCQRLGEDVLTAILAVSPKLR
ncbi:murein tripeptide amidase MpaA [Idiomarina loihiensis]|uniref:M14 family metallopeptidase n=1 Tax=Idiomarina TaxID=135575 RepID=UPI000D7147C9|nr:MULTISPECIES: M14-type cytosolic carboxypeptidase [Idiomarina]MDV6326920.1 M14-type cytosolic carboxypeptidase [Idiomarina sp. Sol25]PWW39152.1 murein tripeptide amidase MpaA [Idiomarina loihiensis]TDP49753.1 murein tripeptide amidase MpaA [Idiomarina loihiensis]TDS23933.1 murein tripeptide amidase MpaA [Idiomarina sp. H2]